MRLGAAGAVLACLCAAVIGLVMRSVPEEVTFQPSTARATPAGCVRAATEHPAACLVFFAADSVLLIAYTMVFVGLHACSVQRRPRLARLGLATGILMAGADALENGIYSRYALAALGGATLAGPNGAWLCFITGTKEVAAGASFLLFALALRPWERVGHLVPRLLLLAPLVGLLSLALPSLIRARGWAIIAPMPFIAVWLWRRSAGLPGG